MYSNEGLDDFASPEDLSSNAFDCDPDISGFNSFDLAIDDIPDTLLVSPGDRRKTPFQHLTASS